MSIIHYSTGWSDMAQFCYIPQNLQVCPPSCGKVFTKNRLKTVLNNLMLYTVFMFNILLLVRLSTPSKIRRLYSLTLGCWGWVPGPPMVGLIPGIGPPYSDMHCKESAHPNSGIHCNLSDHPIQTCTVTDYPIQKCTVRNRTTLFTHAP